MKQVTFTEVRNHAKQYFDIVASGESVRVLRNGKPIADIVPVAADLTSWKRRKAQPVVLDGVSLSRMIFEEHEISLMRVFLMALRLSNVTSVRLEPMPCWTGAIKLQK